MAEKIISPGVFTNEIDQSFLPAAVADIGAVIIGPTVKGPALSPVIVSSYSDYQAKFGDSFKSGSSYNSIKKWSNNPLATGSVSSSSGSSKVFQFSTKDFTFGNIANRKKIYKVYITYKVGTDGTDSGITVEGAINGSGDFTEVDFSTSSTFTGGGNCYDSSTLNETDGGWKIAELKFASPSTVNNIYSFQLKLSGTAIPADFEINDISIVFRIKRVK